MAGESPTEFSIWLDGLRRTVGLRGSGSSYLGS
jgi:hypothetical protein